MKLYGDALFNLLVNAVASFWLGLAVVAVVFAVFRPIRGSGALLLLLLPFGKLLSDLWLGIPQSSFFWAYELGVKQRLGSFQIGIGAVPWGLNVQGLLWAEHAAGRSPQSIADLGLRALHYRVSPYAASVLSALVLAVSTFKIGHSCLRLGRFRRHAVALRAGSATEVRAVRGRLVSVFADTRPGGVPFAGGLFRPYVVMPAALETRLSPSEREAVIQHELGHIARWDLALLVPLELLSDLFWYVPGIGLALSRLQRLLEQRADDSALATGVRPEVMASALVTVGEVTLDGDGPLLAICRRPSSLGTRVRRLLEPEAPRPAATGWFAAARALIIVWLALGALQATACGNHL